MLVLEDGSGVTGANAYIAIADADSYHSARGNATWIETSTSPDQGKAAAIIRATAAIDARYRARFQGYKTHGREQPLQWPRTSAWDTEGLAIASDEIPQEIKDAVCEAALREIVEAGSMFPDLDPQAKRLKAGSVEIEYAGDATPQTVYQLIDGILAGLLGAQKSYLSGVAIRG
jgi:hypothetical protein